MIINFKRAASCLLTACLLGATPAVLAQADEAVLKYRQSVMRAIGGHMGAIGSNAKGNLGHGADVKAHARSLHALSKMIVPAFKQQTEGGKTRSKPKIWSDWSGFKKAAKQSVEALGALVAAVEYGGSGVTPGKMKAVGKSCKGCHKEYRKKKK